MKLNYSKSESHIGKFQRAIVIVAILSIAGSGIPSSSAQLKSQKRITSLQSSETASGTRVSVFSDVSLGDYEAFRRGDRFYIKVPAASFDAPPPNLRGDGFEDIQVQRVGDSIVVSFRLQPGTNARVDQRSNRLDVYFTSPNKTARNSSPNGQPMRTTTKSVPGIVTLETARSQQAHRNRSDAGPMPPDTPGASRPRVAAQQQAAYRPTGESTAERIPSRNSLAQQASSRGNRYKDVGPSETKPASSLSLKPDSDRSSSDSNTPTSLTPSATPYQPSLAPTPYSSYTPRPVAPASATSSSSGWAKRLDQAKQWLSMNRLPAGIAGAVLAGLTLLSLALLYRRRRKPIPAMHKKVPGVQPKFSQASELDDLHDDFGAEDYETVFDDYAGTGSRPKSNANLPLVHESEIAEGMPLWEDELTESKATEVPGTDALTSNIPATPMVPIHAMKHDEYEREVFEL